MLHQEHVGGLSLHIQVAHDYGTLHGELGAGGSRGDTMLAGPGGCHHTPPAHALGEHGLSEGIVDFVSSAVVEIFSLEVNVWAFAPAVLVVMSESLSEVEWSFTANVICQCSRKLALYNYHDFVRK